MSGIGRAVKATLLFSLLCPITIEATAAARTPSGIPVHASLLIHNFPALLLEHWKRGGYAARFVYNGMMREPATHLGCNSVRYEGRES
jgi:hypothetical protein